MSESKSLVAFSGYHAKINPTLSVNFNSSYRSEDKHNYKCTYEVVVDGNAAWLTIEEIYSLVNHLQKILSISNQIPHIGNVNVYPS
jgi:long-subunit fatty acid transport protein